MPEFFIGECPVCRQGQLIIVKDLNTDRLLVVCDDCGSQWDSPELASSYETVRKDEVSKVVEPTLAEIRIAGWEKFLSTSAQ
jgi:hypothetical protein